MAVASVGMVLIHNLCKANIKSFITGRRAWLFADTPKGTNAVLYTLVESPWINGLEVFAYLKYLLTERPNNHHPANRKKCLKRPHILHYAIF